MSFKKLPILIAISSLAVVGLVAFQLFWIQHSNELAESVFKDKVCMALCSTVDQQGAGLCCSWDPPADSMNSLPSCQALETDTNFQRTLEEVLGFYQLNMPYEVSFSEEATKVEVPGTYQCSKPMVEAGGEEIFVNLSFPDKENNMLDRMWFMFIVTILVILFITSIFVWTNWNLWKQKRQAEINTDFFNNMAHEFRTPLTNISLAARMLQKKKGDLNNHEYLKIIERENEKLVAQTERVLHLSSLENGEYQLQKEDLNVKNLIAGVKDEMQMLILENEAEVCIEAMEEKINISGDKLHLSNVFKNLLDNALKYCQAKPIIQFSSETSNQGTTIKVQDNGIGIPKSRIGQIFEKFQRVGQDNIHKTKGFGLGLAYVKMMVERHDGKIKVNSQIGKGSQFEVFLPK